MLSNDIINGVGLLKKKEFVKPYWFGLESMKEFIEEINDESRGVLENLVVNCRSLDTDTINDFVNTIQDFGVELNKINVYGNTQTIDFTPDQGLYDSNDNPVSIKPLYISNLGPITNKETSLGKINQDFKDTFVSVVYNYTLPVTVLCETIKEGNELSSPLGSVSGIIDNLQDSMSSITDDVVDLMIKYKKYITEYLLGTFLGFNIVLMIFIFIEAIVLIVYSNRNYNLIRRHLICIWAFIGFMLIFFFIFAGIFGIVSSLISDVGDIVDFIFSSENLNSQEPRIVSGGENIQKIDICLRGDGDLLNVFLEEESSIQFTDSINTLFNMYLPIKHYIELGEDSKSNYYNSLSSIDDLIEEYENYQNDFLLTTSYQEHGNLDMTIELDELNKYTVYGRYYQDKCVHRIYDLYVPTKSKCPSNSGYTCIKISDLDASTTRYDSACPLVSSKSPTFNSVKEAVQKLGVELKNYESNNKDILTNLLVTTNPSDYKGIKDLQNYYKNDFVTRHNAILTSINENIISGIYNAFKNYVNLEKLEAGEKVNIFSWMNCSVFGRDLNATLNIMKKHFKKDMQNMFIITLVNNGIIISQMVILTFLLNWYKYDPLENNPVGEMEIKEKEKKIDDEKISNSNEEEENEDDENNEYDSDKDIKNKSDDRNDSNDDETDDNNTNKNNKKKNNLDSPELIEVNNNKNNTKTNNFITNDDNKFLPSDNDSEDSFKRKMMQRLNTNTNNNNINNNNNGN
jgi:hypothetical protein